MSLSLTDLLKKLSIIQLLVLDVDGILTNGCITLTAHNDEIKTFHAHDGFGIQLLQKTGVTIAVISARKSQITYHRLQALGVQTIFQGEKNKQKALQTLVTDKNLPLERVAYMGDDWLDLKAMQTVGLSITVPNATDLVKAHADWMTTRYGGQGAVREVCEKIMQAQNTLQALQQHYVD